MATPLYIYQQFLPGISRAILGNGKQRETGNTGKSRSGTASLQYNKNSPDFPFPGISRFPGIFRLPVVLWISPSLGFQVVWDFPGFPVSRDFPFPGFPMEFKHGQLCTFEKKGAKCCINFGGHSKCPPFDDFPPSAQLSPNSNELGL